MLGNKGNGKQFYRNGGTRGGQNQFKWDDVKSDKYKDNYLGNSVLAPTGRWQNGKDLNWYTKSLSTDKKRLLDNEIEMMKQNDADLINEALGIRPAKKRSVQNLDSVELKQLLARGGSEREEFNIERVKGLGAAPSKLHEHIEHVSGVEKEIRKLKSGGSLSVDDSALDGNMNVLPLKPLGESSYSGSSSRDNIISQIKQRDEPPSKLDDDFGRSKKSPKKEKKHHKDRKSEKKKKDKH